MNQLNLITFQQDHKPLPLPLSIFLTEIAPFLDLHDIISFCTTCRLYNRQMFSPAGFKLMHRMRGARKLKDRVAKTIGFAWGTTFTAFEFVQEDAL